MADMDAVAASLAALLATYGVTRDQMADLLGGAADGGPNHDGNYPVTLSSGMTVLVPSPRRLAALSGDVASAVAAIQPILDAANAAKADAVAARDGAVGARDAASSARDKAIAAAAPLSNLVTAIARPPIARNGLVALTDSFGRAAARMLGDGSIAIHRLVRDDGTDVYAQLDALAGAGGNVGGKSANTLALINAIRTLGSFPALAPKPADAATVSVGGPDAASAISGSALLAAGAKGVLLAPFSPRFGLPRAINGATDDFYGSWMGAKGAYRNTGSDGTVYYGASSAGFEFVQTGTELEISYLGNGDANRAARLLVNDCEVWRGVVPNDSHGHLLHVVFPSAGTRRLSWESAGSTLFGVRIGAGNSLSRVAFDRPWIVADGDSQVDEQGAKLACSGYLMTGGRYLGCAVNNLGVGSTGIIGAGNASPYVDPHRIADLTMAGSGVTPALGLICGTQNDNIPPASYQPYGTTLEQAVANGCATLIEAWLSALPGKPLVFYAPWVVNGLDTYPPPIGVMQIRDGMQKAAAQYHANNVHFIDRLDRSLMPGVASGDATVMPAAYYSDTDHLHHSQAGHDMQGFALGRSLETLIMGTLA